MIRRLLSLAAAAAFLAVVPLTGSTAEAAPATPGNFQGRGFDQCLAPDQAAMNRWLEHSPFLAVGIYISGDSRGCRNQPNLTPTWVATQLRKGWRLLPITLGPQASCHPKFPRYGDDETINPNPGTSGGYAAARRQARAEATTTVAEAQRLGIRTRSTLWYDLEGFDISRTRCRESALAFLSAWTNKVRSLGYVSGVYSSAASGLRALDNARVNRPDRFTMPDRVWIADWDGRANTSSDWIRDDGWRPGGRMKQYRGGHTETWGGVTINIDSNWLNLGRGLWAAPESHCEGTRIDFRWYPRLDPGTRRAAVTKALQCLLTEKGFYTGRIHGYYGGRVVEAVNAWQESVGLPTRSSFGPQQWQRLLAQGRVRVLKTGSTGPDVRRVQRALNTTGARLSVTGLYDAPTRVAVNDYRRRVGMRATGIFNTPAWHRIRGGAR